MILVAGSANLDFVVRAACIPAPGQTLLGKDFQTFPGGKGANQAVAAARAGGAAASFLAAMGCDDFAKPVLASLQSAGVEVAVIQSALPTGVAFICVSDEGENTITVAPGANLDLKPEHWLPQSSARFLLMQLETPLPTVQAFAQAAKKQGVQVVLNAAPAPTSSQALIVDLLRWVDILIVNEGELLAICDAEYAQTATKSVAIEHLRNLTQKHSLKTVIVTLGGEGCIALHEGDLIEQAAYRVNALDTTGAGDTFCGCLVAALDHGLTMKDALRQASAAAALACTVLGAQNAIPTHSAVQQLMQESDKNSLQQHGIKSSHN